MTSMSASLDDLIERWSADEKALPPVHTWAPTHRGSIDIHIDVGGNWFHEGGAITRPSLVTLFASILRRDQHGSYALVTPVESLAISVEDVPFSIVDLELVDTVDATSLWVATTSHGERVPLDAAHPLRAGDPSAGETASAYVCVRPASVAGPGCLALEGRLTRPAWYRLAEQLTVEGEFAVLHSGGHAHKVQL